MLENQTISELLDMLVDEAFIAEKQSALFNFKSAMQAANTGLIIREIILSKFKQLEEYKFMYEGLTK